MGRRPPGPRTAHAAIEAASELAEESLLAGDLRRPPSGRAGSGSSSTATRTALWRMLIAARDRAARPGAATRDRREYAAVLEALGVGVAASASARHA